MSELARTVASAEQRVLLVEPYYGGSHRAWADGWVRHSRHHIELLTLPDEFWRWRLRGGAVTLAEAFEALVARAGAPDAVVLSAMADAAVFAGIARRSLRDVPLAVYVHESQLLYPLAPKQAADSTSSLINWRSLVAADAVWFNSAFHRDELRRALPGLLRSQPTPSHEHLIEDVFARASVLWPPVEIDHLLAAPRSSNPVPRVLWNQRWDHDKHPRAVFRALAHLADEGVEFTLSLAGQNLRPRDPELVWVHDRLRDRIDHTGFLDDAGYAGLLTTSDVVVSAAAHEFFGIAFIEAMAAGAVPVVPARLSFPEIIDERWHDELLYEDGELRTRLRRVLTDLEGVRARVDGLRASMQRFAAPKAADAHDRAVDRLIRETTAR